MKIAHIADLHIGRRFEDLSLIEDQRYIFNEILKEVTEISVDVLIIAGDVYDKISPSTEAFELWNAFLEGLAIVSCQVIIISGNHDSNDRLGVGGRLFASHGIHLISSLEQALTPIVIDDCFGHVNFYAIPFIKPVDVRNVFRIEEITSYDEAFSYIVNKLNVDVSKRNVLIAHQFFVNGSQNPSLSDSEVANVGGLDAIDVKNFDLFDYAAFGHIHGPQQIMKDSIRYSGSPLKYSFSEVHHIKSMPVVTLQEKGDIKIDFTVLTPMRDVRIITGTLDQLLEAGRIEPSMDYIKAILTDEDDVYDAMGKLRSIYPNIVNLEIQNQSSQSNEELIRANHIIEKSHIERFDDLYTVQNNRSLDENERNLLQSLILEVSIDETH